MDFEFNREQLAFRDKIREFAQGVLAPIACEIDDSSQFPHNLYDILRKEGLFRYLTPKEYGGEGICAINLCIIREELSRKCLKADEIFAAQGLGSYPIIRFGNEAQKKRYLPSIASGERTFVFALTEPNAGSDVANISTFAISNEDGYLINGHKRFIAFPDAANVYLLFAKTEPSQGSHGISAFVVEGRPKGIEVNTLRLMGENANGEIIFKDCRIPKSSLLQNHGDGMKIALTNLDLFRASVGAAAVGMGQAALDESLTYAKTRTAFGQKLSQFQAIQMKLADMATKLEAARLLVYRAATRYDKGQEKPTIEVSMAKLFATEAAQFITDEAVQIHGGVGLLKGVMVERLYRGVRALRIYEGTSEIQRVVIARQLLKEK